MADSFEFVPTRFQGIRGLGISRCLISGSVVVPSSSNGLPVIGVMRESFSNLSSLKEVELPDSLLFIQDEAFERCYSLKTIILPVSLVKIGEKAFSSCCSLETSKYRGTEEQWKQVASGRGNDGFLKTLCFGNRNSLETESSGRKVTLSIGEKLYLRSNEEIELIAILDESHIRISQGAGRRVDFSVKDFGNKFFDKTGLQIYQENKESILRQEAEARAEESQKQVQKSREEARRKIEKEQERKSLEEQWNREAHWLDESRPSPAFNSKPELPIERPKLDFLVDGENEEIADIDVSNLPVDLPIPSSGVSEGKPFF